MNLDFDTSTIVVLVITIFVAATALLRLRMKIKIENVPNFSSSMCFIGPASAINFDFDSGRAAYIELSQKKPTILDSEDLTISGNIKYALTEKIPRYILARFVNAALNGEHHLTVNTNVYALPELKISFWDKKQALQCIIALRQLTNSQFSEQDKYGAERPDSITQKIQSEEWAKDLKEALRQKISASGGIKNIRDPRERDSYIEFAVSWVKTKRGAELVRRDNQLISEALFDHLGDGKNPNGYSLQTILTYVSKMKTAKKNK